MEYYNVALQMPEAVAETARQLSADVAASEEAYFTLSEAGPFPHVTLYQTGFNEEQRADLVKSLQEAVLQLSPVTCAVDGVSSNDGWLGFRLQSTSELVELQRRIVEAASPYRNQPFDPVELFPGAVFSPEQMDNFSQFGYDKLGKLFSPHLTITRLKDGKAAERLAKTLIPPESVQRFTVTELGLFKSGEHGTCQKMLESLPLA